MEELRRKLESIDGKGYGAYKSIKGTYDFEGFQLEIAHVQGDPFAAPSALVVRISMEEAGFPEEWYATNSRKTALEDLLNRKFDQAAHKTSHSRGSGKSGQLDILWPGQEILQRSSVQIIIDHIQVRFYAGLPAKGRKVLGFQAINLLIDDLREIVNRSLYHSSLDPAECERWVTTNEDADYIRHQLKQSGLVAFLANNSILPRKSGVDERPMEEAVPYQSPGSLEVTFECPNRTITGTGIPEGLTLIVGGAYHGKSTLLDAIAKGVYNHIPGDGREFVITREDAVNIRSEDKRYVEKVDISTFIDHLPDGSDARQFSTENASGSTSQAANMAEALEAGARSLLIDEDTTATNLMIRDRRVQELVPTDKEPITPFIDTIQTLRDHNISIIMIVGGLGDYFDLADHILMMDRYEPKDVTDQAKKIAGDFPSDRMREEPKELSIHNRTPLPTSIDATRKGKVKIKVRDDKIQFGNETIDLSKVEQLAERGQLEAIGQLLTQLEGQAAIADHIERMDEKLNNGFEWLKPSGRYSRPRRYELAAALNRLRIMRVED